MMGFVYILASKRNGTLYTGVTCDLQKRVYEHKAKLVKGFASQYNVNMLVYYAQYGSVVEAIEGEGKIKNMPRKHKLRLN